jgi:hypothetical protein
VARRTTSVSQGRRHPDQHGHARQNDHPIDAVKHVSSPRVGLIDYYLQLSTFSFRSLSKKAPPSLTGLRVRADCSRPRGPCGLRGSSCATLRERAPELLTRSPPKRRSLEVRLGWRARKSRATGLAMCVLLTQAASGSACVSRPPRPVAARHLVAVTAVAVPSESADAAADDDTDAADINGRTRTVTGSRATHGPYPRRGLVVI